MKILLGSNSPRRNELLNQMGITFTKVSIDCDEDFDADMIAEEVPVSLSKKKSAAYTDLQDEELLITADTVVICEEKILNKPQDEEDALEMLWMLSDTSHKVVTGVTLRSLQREVSFSSTTLVHLDKLTDSAVNYYLGRYKPYDKAGSYGIQEWFGLSCVKGIEGCFYNVVGLPCSLLYKRLKNDFDVI
jgi:septum formation protein